MVPFKPIGYFPSSKIFKPKLVNKSSEEGLLFEITVQSNHFKKYQYTVSFLLEKNGITKEEHLRIKVFSPPFPVLVIHPRFVKGLNGEILTNIPPLRPDYSRNIVLPTTYYQKKHHVPFLYEYKHNILHHPVYLADEFNEITETIHLYAYIALVDGIEYLVIDYDTQTRVHIESPNKQIFGFVPKTGTVAPFTSTCCF